MNQFSAEETQEYNHGLVGQSPAIGQVLRLAGKLGKSRWPVLLLGETGTGKEVVAKAIYNTNPVGPFVTVDCSSIVGQLMESELFGYIKGAFTGANNNKIGLIESANGGTAFFDEIGELPLDLQVKLLRVIQQKEFRPVGASTVRNSDFRIIAATNRDLAACVGNGTFRQDLFYRLNVVGLRLPPLRERLEDIPLLIAHFLEHNGRNHSLTQEAFDTLLAYDWPGNVRELENCIQKMVAINTGPLLHCADLPSPIRNHMFSQKPQHFVMAAGALDTARRVAQTNGHNSRIFSETSPIMPLCEMERKAILGALEYTRGDRAIAAHLLGIGRTTLYRKLKEYQLETEAAVL